MLSALPLARAGHDRAAERRDEPDLVPRLLADPATRVLVLTGDTAPVLDVPALDVPVSDAPALDVPALDPATGPDGVRLALTDPATFAAGAGKVAETLAYLGRVEPPGSSPIDVVAALLAPDAAPADPPQVRRATLREIGPLLDAVDVGLFTTALALGNWHHTHPRCSRCGGPSDVAQAGWSRRCPACGAAHFPRTDPAVIMAVVDDDDRILLGHQGVWPAGRYSTLAGFVEPGESLEAAVRREVLEEAGVQVGEVTYRGSQPWPFPASLMLAFTARAVTTWARGDGVEIVDVRWWTRDQLLADIASGDLLLPPRLSIARSLIEDWFGAPIHDAGGAWR